MKNVIRTVEKTIDIFRTLTYNMKKDTMNRYEKEIAMKKVLSLALAVLMLLTLSLTAFAVKDPIISPEAKVEITKIVITTGDGKRIEVPAYDMDGYYILLYSEDTADESLKEIYHALYPDGEKEGIETRNIALVFGAKNADYNLLTLFRIDRVGTPIKHDFVEFSVYVPNAVDGNSYEILAQVDGEWKKVDIVKFKNGIFTFEVPYKEAVTNYAILYKRSKTSPTTGMENSMIFLIPAVCLCVLGCAYTGKKYLFD